MLRRLYVDSFRSFVNFELPLGRQQLILGLNGCGKSTLLEVLSALKRLVTGVAHPDSPFPETSRTRWQLRSRQTFEHNCFWPNRLTLIELANFAGFSTAAFRFMNPIVERFDDPFLSFDSAAEASIADRIAFRSRDRRSARVQVRQTLLTPD
jgi:energy-coupling factor transporter ATP-binding protein EcfA2